MKKTLGIIIFVLVIVNNLTACGNQKLPDTFDEQTVTDTAKQVVSYMNDKDYDSVTAMVEESLQPDLSAEVLEDAVEQVCPNTGTFTDYKSISVTGQSSKDNDYAVVIVIAEYENQNVTYTLTFNTDMELTGFYLK